MEPEIGAFDRIIAPLSRERFLSDFWGQSFLRLPGEPGRFRSLLSWDELSAILERHRLEPPRIRLVRDGRTIEPERFFTVKDGPPRLKPASLVNCLADGATLILDSVQEFAPRVLEVAEGFQDALRAMTVVNLYAGWRTQHGFDLHWDSQDTTILQVAGRKKWRVHRPTRLHPLTNDLGEAPKPTDEPVWEGILEDGDAIYVPRGWWHVAFPLDEPSLHLTVTVVPATGADVLTWFAHQMKRHADFRMNVPHVTGPADRNAYVSRTRQLMLECWSDDVLDRFLAEWESHVPLRPQIRLPLAPIERGAPITMETRVRLATNRQLSFVKGTDDSVAFHANGVQWTCSRDLVPSLEQLTNSCSHSVAQLCAPLSDDAARRQLTVFLADLASGGAVWIECETHV